jgi:hypothetical protein
VYRELIFIYFIQFGHFGSTRKIDKALLILPKLLQKKMPNFLNRSKLTGNLLSFYLALSFAQVKMQPKNLMKSISQASETWTWDFRFRELRYLIFAVKSVGFRSTHYTLIYQDPT